MYWFKTLLKKLTAPHPRIKDEEEQINSRLLSTLLIILLPVSFIFLISLTVSYSHDVTLNADVIIFSGMLAR